MQIRRRTSGQSIVELALLLPFFIFLTIGTIELGYYVYTYAELENAARRAAEWAADAPPLTATPADDFPGGGEDRCALLIKEWAMGNVFLSKLAYNHITISYPTAAQRERGALIQVAIDYKGDWLTPLGKQYMSDRLNFKFTARRTIRDVGPPAGLNANCQS
jgi:hypothetical protein